MSSFMLGSYRNPGNMCRSDLKITRIQKFSLLVNRTEHWEIAFELCLGSCFMVLAVGDVELEKAFTIVFSYLVMVTHTWRIAALGDLFGVCYLILFCFGVSVQLVPILYLIEETEGRRYVPCPTKVSKTLVEMGSKDMCASEEVLETAGSVTVYTDPCLEEHCDTRQIFWW